MVSIGLHAILFQTLEYQDVYIYIYIYTSFWDATKQPKTYDVLRKDCNSDTKDVYIPHSFFLFYEKQLWLLVNIKFKVRKSFYLLMKFYVKNGIQKEFLRCVLHKRRSAASMLHIYRRIPIQKCDFSRVELTLLHGYSPVNWLNLEHLSRKTHLGDIYGKEYNRCQPTFTFSELT